MPKARRAKVNANIVNQEEDGNVFPELNTNIKLKEVNYQVQDVNFLDVFLEVLKILDLNNQSQEIISLRDKNNNPVFDQKNNPSFNLDLLEILRKEGLDSFKTWVQQIDLTDAKVIWNHQIFDEMKLHEFLDADIFLNRKQPVKGVGVCSNCKNPYLFVEMKQVRASDEPITVFFYCPKCGKKWREG